MAIEVTNFTGYTGYQTSFAEVGDWLAQNAAEYFPGGIVNPQDRSWTWRLCPIEGDTTTAAVLAFHAGYASNSAPGSLVPKYASSAVTCSPAYSSERTGFKMAAKTSNGVVLCHENGNTWFFSKTNEGHTCVVAHGDTRNNVASWRAYATDLENDVDVVTLSSYDGTGTNNFLSQRTILSGCPLTTLLPVVFSRGTWAPNMFMTHYTEAVNADGRLQTVTIDGQEYIYDGFIALKG